MRVLVTIVTVVVGILTLGSYLGALHPLGDSLAVLRLPLLTGFALLVIWSAWPRRFRWPLALGALVGMGVIIMPKLLSYGPPSDHELVLYQQNLLFSRAHDKAWLDLVARHAPDVLTLQEVSGRNKALLAALSETYPHQHYCDFATVGGVAVLSKLPVIPQTKRCAARDGAAAMQIMSARGPVWLVSVHLHWPYPFGQAAQVDRLMPFVGALEGPVVVGGDFNAVGWSNAVKRFTTALGGARVSHRGPTFHLPLGGAPITIDHVLTSPAYAQGAVSLPKAGSDHHGIKAYLRLKQE